MARVDTDLGDLSAMESGEATPSFGALLRQHRLNRSLTQAALAERAGLSERAIQHLERGRGQPYHETAQRLADALALTPGQRAAFDVAAAPAPRHRRKRQPSELPGSETPPSGEAADGDRPGVSELSGAAPCPACAVGNPPDARFCRGCGSSLTGACPACGLGNGTSSRFCTHCGAALASLVPSEPRGSTAGPSGAGPIPNSEVVLGRLETHDLPVRGALDGERKQVTVLFAEITDAAGLIQTLDPEDAETLLDAAVGSLRTVAHDYQGTISQIQGTGIVALFGAPIAHEDHALRACYAALAMRAVSRRAADEMRHRHGVAMQIRVGLSSGEVVVRAISNDLHSEQTAVGRPVHLAARMAQLASPETIWLAAETQSMVEGFVQTRALDPIAVAGLDEPVVAYELLEGGAIRERVRVSAARGLTPFVGRDAELGALQLVQARVMASHGQIVAVIGEPGLGKSRLCYELTRSPQTRGWLVLETGLAAHERTTPYLPAIDLLKTYCGVDARDDLQAIETKLTGKLRALDGALEPDLPALLALLDVPVDDPAWRTLGPHQRRRRTLDAFTRLLVRVSQDRPLLLIFENLHWVDGETQALLDRLVESLPMARILLLVNYRPEYQHGWGNTSAYTQLRLNALPPDSADALLRSLMGDDSTVQPLRQMLIERTDANPFFLEESVRTLVETGLVADKQGAYRLGEAAETIRLPATVQAVLAARIDRLSPDAKHVLQSAAVIGKDVPLTLLQAIMASPGLGNGSKADSYAVQQGLAQLKVAEFLYEASLFPEVTYTFKHGLTQEVAYGSLLRTQRRALHTQIVDAIESLHPDRLSEWMEALANHARRGELWSKAAAYQQRAGEKAAARLANREAVAWFEQALESLKHLPDDRDTRSQTIDVHLHLRQPLLALAQHDRIVRQLQEAEALAAALGDQRRIGQCAIYAATQFAYRSDHQSGLAAGYRALAAGIAADDAGIELDARARLGWTYHALGAYGQAIAFGMEAVQARGGTETSQRFHGPGLPAVLARTWLIPALAEVGRFEEGITLGGEALTMAETVGHPWNISPACIALGVVHLRQGRLAQAMHLFERADDYARVGEVTVFATMTAILRGYTCALLGRPTEGLPLLRRSIEQAAAGINQPKLSLHLAHLGEALLLDGQREAAAQHAERARDLAEALGERGNQAWAVRLLGEVAASGESPDAERAEDWYREALALAEELGMRPLQAHCHRGLARLFGRIGRADEAHTERETAVALLRELGMTYWLPSAETALATASR